VVDIGTNSTRLLVADVQDGALTELERRTTPQHSVKPMLAAGKMAAAGVVAD